MPKVFIIILNWNGWNDTLECLRSLEKVEYNNFEVILIDNASKEPMPQIGGQFPNLKITQIFNEQNLGFAGGNNQGIKLALANGADYVLLLNNDTAVEPDFLNKLVEAGENDKKAGILGPVIYEYSDPPATPEACDGGRGKNKVQSAGGKINWVRTKGIHIMQISKIYSSSEVEKLNFASFRLFARWRIRSNNNYPVDYLTGCCLLIKKEVIAKIGLISEDYFVYYEDTDWNLRAQRTGYNCVLVPPSKIYHKGSSASQEFSYPYIYYHTRNGLMFGARFGFKPLIYLVSVWIYIKQLIKITIGYKREWAKPVMRGVADFWRGKTGKLAGYY